MISPPHVSETSFHTLVFSAEFLVFCCSLTVLVVDDDDAIVNLMRDFLENDGFRVKAAYDTSQALALLDDSLVDCIIFAFTKLEYTEQTLHHDTVSFSVIVDKYVESLRPLAHNKVIEILVDAPIQDCMVTGDAHLLERTVNNLLDNAIRHTPHSGKIFASWYKEEGRTILSIRDTGPGFSLIDDKACVRTLVSRR